eukprot:6181230-Pleurochrysis_carterae.AAC.3
MSYPQSSALGLPSSANSSLHTSVPHAGARGGKLGEGGGGGANGGFGGNGGNVASPQPPQMAGNSAAMRSHAAGSVNNPPSGESSQLMRSPHVYAPAIALSAQTWPQSAILSGAAALHTQYSALYRNM